MMCLARDRSDQFEEHLPGEEDYRVLPAAHGRHERPVGTRLNYLATIEDRPDSQYEARLVLQSVADGADALDRIEQGQEDQEAMLADLAKRLEALEAWRRRRW